MTNKATIVGSGLTGPLLSILLAKKYNIDVDTTREELRFLRVHSSLSKSFTLTLSGECQFSSQDKATQKKYQTEIARQMKTYDDTAKKYRIPLLSIDTLTPVDSQVRKAFGGK